jgi:methylmalonyl-CoA mutase C-terminal domain/subunit
MPDADVAELKKMGVAEVVGQDAPPDAIVQTMLRLVDEQRARA